jgi:hypothetical protein
MIILIMFCSKHNGFVFCVLCLQVLTFMKSEECGHSGFLVLKDELTSLSCLFLAIHGGS